MCHVSRRKLLAPLVAFATTYHLLAWHSSVVHVIRHGNGDAIMGHA
jgi:hypothetical protein